MTMLTAAGFLFALGAWLYTASAGVLLLALGMLIWLGFYLVHYFRLENSVQHWYNIAEALHNAAESSEKEEKNDGSGI